MCCKNFDHCCSIWNFDENVNITDWVLIITNEIPELEHRDIESNIESAVWKENAKEKRKK